MPNRKSAKACPARVRDCYGAEHRSDAVNGLGVPDAGIRDLRLRRGCRKIGEDVRSAVPSEAYRKDPGVPYRPKLQERPRSIASSEHAEKTPECRASEAYGEKFRSTAPSEAYRKDHGVPHPPKHAGKTPECRIAKTFAKNSSKPTGERRT